MYEKNINRDTCVISDGLNTNDFVFVLVDNKWYLYRISAANTDEVPSYRGEMSLYSTTLSCPSTTTIYFTKSANSNYWGVTSKALSFSSSYLKNVLPKEWYISRYSTTAYANATALASKTYGWYFTEHPKWNYSPYYSNMKDNSSDQNYLYSAYSDLNSARYQGYEDSALSFISNKVIVKANNNTVLEVHYNANSGTEHSGTMNASGCWTMAQSGDSYDTILHYYYDYSDYTGTSVACSVATY